MNTKEKRTILIVDDNAENLQIISDIFTTDFPNCAVVKVPNGEIALNVIEKITPDLIITDWEMPEMDGIELIKNLKKNPVTIDIPIIMCTGVMTSSENLHTALDAGAVDYIRKPVDKIELIARTKANLHLADSYKKIKKLNEAKDKIFAIISHDLRGPVGNTKTLIDLILDKQNKFDEKTILSFIAMIGEQSASVFAILENLLAWANSQRNNIVFQPVFQDIDLAIHSNVELLKDIASKKEITISNETNKSILINFDLTLISTVVRNLIANALKFTPSKGKITINTEKTDSQLIISVADNGVGISKDRIDKIFDKTSYETTFGTNDEKGSGLGLKLCLEFIEKHEGKIWVESEVGVGSTFKFSLPS